MSYGIHGLTNYDGIGPRPQTKLMLKTYDVKKRKLSDVTKALQETICG